MSTTQTPTQPAPSVAARIAEELQVAQHQVSAAVDLLDNGATVPFIARYRKEVTAGLDDTQLRTLEERLTYLRELDERRQAILSEIENQGKLDDPLKQQILAAETKARLEDIYLPYKPKRRTKAQIAREAGLEPLAETLLTDPSQDPRETAASYVDAEKNIADAAAALEGARSILVERFTEDADLIGALRERMWQQGVLRSAAREGQETAGAKFSDYFDFSEEFTRLVSHRTLALFRGESEQALELTLDPGESAAYEQKIAEQFGISHQGRPADQWLADCVRWAWRTRILVRLDMDLRVRLRQAAEEAAVDVFAGNLRDVLLAAPAGQRPTLGLDPGYRTGVKVAIVDATSKVVATDTIYPHQPQGKWEQALATLDALVRQHGVELVAIGNGTASRETDQLAAELVRRSQQNLTKVLVSEAGASVYSASAYAARELPELDVSLRGAVSIARRLQDPLAELVKIEPKSIGVGQYQHDLPELALARSLDTVVEDCVNAVGVDVNTASAPLLARVSGITTGLAENIVVHRDTHGPFSSRSALTKVPRLGPKAFEQCAGFLRIRGGDDPLDASSVHPEAYPVVRRILDSVGDRVSSITELIGNSAQLRQVKPADYVDEHFGIPTVTDILAELDKPGRDPRGTFRAATFADGVNTLNDVRAGMTLEGVVTNVAAFGAFVDIGVHQDGLVHISALSHEFVRDPRDVVKPGDIVTVRVLDVDVARKRISLTLRLDDEPTGSSRQPARGAQGKPAQQGKPASDRPGKSGTGGKNSGKNAGKSSGRNSRAGGGSTSPQGAMAEALRRAGLSSE